jgi:hypothetical protein
MSWGITRPISAEDSDAPQREHNGLEIATTNPTERNPR